MKDMLDTMQVRQQQLWQKRLDSIEKKKSKDTILLSNPGL
jgi:hypothetical protein